MFKSKYSKYFIILVLFFSLTAFISDSKTDENNKERNALLNRVLIYVLDNAHYSPCDINDEFSASVFNDYIEKLDYNKIFLVQSDIENLKKYKTEIDDEIKKGNFDFFDLSFKLINKRIDEAENYYKEILEKPFDFTEDGEIQLDKEKLSFAKDKKELKEVWYKYIKYQTLLRIQIRLDAQKIAKEKNDTTVKIKSFETIEVESRKKITKTYKELFHRLEKYSKNDDRFSIYLNSIVEQYDPHTSYFPPRDKENFDILMSGKLEGIGATLQQKDIYVSVVNIVPGSASWRQGDLETGDIILKVAQGDEDAVDIVDMRLDDAVKLVRGKKGSVVRLTVKKIDGSIKVIPIIRDIVVIEETYAKSLIINNDDEKIGYILLPSFYADFKDAKGRNSADDVKKEIEHLNEEGVSGIIFDLRNNGGGALVDAVKIVGMFIDNGPVVQVKSKNANPQVLSDNEPGVLFDKPLVVLVNSLSASASEIFAAAIQDYNRGIIMGSKSSFGKGTVQRFVDLDRFIRNYKGSSLGSLKITFQKFYRINGGATQMKGVIPDIIIPDNYSYLDVGEKDLEHPLEWDEIEPLNWQKYNPSYDFDKIAGEFNNNILSDSSFILIDQYAKRLKELKDNSSYPLNFEKYLAKDKLMDEENKKFDTLNKYSFDINASVLKNKLDEMKSDTIKKQSMDKWIKAIKKDAELNKAVELMKRISLN